MSDKDCRFESTIEGPLTNLLNLSAEPLSPNPTGIENDDGMLVFEAKNDAAFTCLVTSTNEMEASASTQAPNAGSDIDGGGSRSSLYAYAPNNNDDLEASSFSGSFGLIKEINIGGREREMSSVGDVSMRSALKQAKRERRQKAKEGDTEQAFAGSNAGDSCDDEGMEEIVALPTRGARRSSENAWAAPLVNLMNKEEVESPQPSADEKPRSKRDNLRRGKRQLMSGWCQDLDNQKRETQVMDWMADLGSAVPNSSFSIARSGSQANTENQYSIESGTHYESSSSVVQGSSIVQGLREIVGSARAATATEMSRPNLHPTYQRRVPRSASFSDEVTTSIHVNTTGGGALPLPGFDFVGGESITKRVSQTVNEPHQSPIVAMHENSTVLAMGEHDGEDVILTARRPTETDIEGGNTSSYLLSPSHTTLPIFFGGHHLVAHSPPRAAETTTISVGAPEAVRAVRPRDAIDAIHKLRISEEIYESRINPLGSDSSATSLFSGERSMESSCYLPESPQLFRDMNDSIHIANNRMAAKGECAVDFGFAYGDELASPPSEAIGTDKQPDSSPVIEKLTHIGGIRTQPIPRPKRPTSTVTLNECVYNLHFWSVEELGWFVIPSDNIDDTMMHSEGVSGESGSSSTNPRGLPTFSAPDDSRTDDDISMKNPLGEQVGASPVVGCRADSLTSVPLSHQLPPPGPFGLNSSSTGVPPPEVVSEGSANLSGLSPHLGVTSSHRMPLVVGITKDSSSSSLHTTISPPLRASGHLGTAPSMTGITNHASAPNVVSQRVDPNESSRSVSAFGNAVIHNIPPSAGGAFRSSSTSLFPQQHLPAPTTPHLQRAPTPLQRVSSVTNSSVAGCDTPMGRSSNAPYYGDVMRANSISQPFQTPPPTSPRILSTPQGNAVDILSAFFTTGQPGVSTGATPQHHAANNSTAFGTSSTSHSDRACTPTNGPFHPSTPNQREKGNYEESGVGGGGESMRYSLSSAQFGASQFLGDADVDYSTSARLNSINSLNVHKQQEQTRRLALAQFHMQFKSLLVQLQQPTVNRPPIRVGAPPKRWSGVCMAGEASSSEPIATLIPTFGTHSISQQGSSISAPPTVSSPPFEWSMSAANATSSSRSRFGPLPYFADIIAHYKVIVDTLTHAATNHTLQLAHPLSGVNARSYRRSEARFKKEVSSTPSETK